jgi:hypothetical protein
MSQLALPLEAYSGKILKIFGESAMVVKGQLIPGRD